MARRLVSDIDLIHWLNDELHKSAEHVDCHFDGPILKLKEPDVDGCNWSLPLVRGSGVPVKICLDEATEVLRRARALFNLE